MNGDDNIGIGCWMDFYHNIKYYLITVISEETESYNHVSLQID